MLLLVAQAEVADWTGTWYHSGGSDGMCLPGGLLTIKQDSNGKATIEGKYDKYASNCKPRNLAGKNFKVEAQAQEDKLVFPLPTATCTLTRKEKDQSGIRCEEKGLNWSKLYSFDLVKKESSTKFADWEGNYIVTPVSGVSEKCCFPESFEIENPEDALYYSNIKWSDSDACKTVKINGQEWKEVHSGAFVPSGKREEIVQRKPLENDGEYEGYAHKEENGTLTYHPYVKGSGVFGSDCPATLEKKKSWTGVIITVVVVAVLVIAGVVGFFVWRKRQASTAAPTEYERMINASA